MDDTTHPTAVAQQTLQRGLAQIEQGDHAAATQSLRAALQHPATRLAAHNLIERHALQGNFAQMMGLNCEISPADDIFRFFSNHPTSANPLRDYLADGWRTLSELMVLLEAVDQPLLKTGRFLEFASGHGRFTRHLVKALGAERVTVSDVVADAVDFSRTTFGVHSFVSSGQPENVQWPARYDVVFVLSLFSHLPRSTWLRWLERLYDALAPGGLLVFSTHGLKAARHDSVALDAEGFAFWPSSESQAIDAQEYGTAFTSDDFVLARIGESMGLDKLVHRANVHFWNHQDAYVLRHP